jgi:hypothetical protein
MGAVNWKIAADRSVVGEAVELKTLPGLHVKPRKYSVRGDAEINAARIRSLAQVRSDALREVAGAFSEAKQSDDQMGGLTPDQRKDIAVKVMEGATADMMGQIDEKRFKLFYGVHAHDFDGEYVAPTLEWADAILEYPEVTAEILSIVDTKNVPLAKPTSGSSATSPNGNLTEQSSEEAEGSSPTDQTPAS